jgi:iron complex outermembrane recepter protein
MQIRHVTIRGFRARALAAVAAAVLALGHAAAPASAQVLPAAGRAAEAPLAPVVQDTVVIDGRVIDAVTRTPLPGTMVRIVELGRQDITHRNGEFHLTNLAPGRYTLLFERIGYRRVVRQVETFAGQGLLLEIEMSPSAIELPGLVVTGTVGARLGDEAVRPTAVISGQELLRKLDVTLGASLRHEPGLALTTMGPATGRPVIRGLGGDRVLVLEDGVRVGDLSATSPDHAVASDPLNARRIEVVRGPAAILYGSNAIGGVVNVIRDEVPRSLPDRPTGTLSMQGQSVNRGGALGGWTEAAFGTTAVRAEASVRGAGDLQVPGSALENTGMRSYDLSAGLGRVEQWGHAGLAYRYYDNSYGVPGGFVGAHPGGVDVEMRRHSLHGSTQVRPARGPFGTIDGTLNYSNYYHRELEDVGITGTEFGLLTGAAEVIGRYTAPGRFGDGAVGMRAQWQDFAAGGAIGTPPAQEWWLAGFFLQEAAAGPFSVQFGGRYDWHGVTPAAEQPQSPIGDIRARSFGSVSGSLGALYDAGAGWRFGASAARAYRTPSITELYSQGPHLAAYSFEVGNPDLDAEYGVGVDGFVRLSRDEVRGEAAVFRNAITNYIYYANSGRTTAEGLPVFQAVAQDALLTGAEANLEWTVLPRVVVEGVVSHVRGTNRATGEPLPMIPPLNGQLQARYERTAYFVGLGWRGAAAQERVGEFETATAGYGLYNAHAGYRWSAAGRIHNVSLRLENLSNALYRDHLSRVKSIMPEAGRSISLTYRLSF